MKQTMRRIDRIIVHCTATPEGRHVTAKDVDNWHRNDRHWANGIGYHYLIYLDGSIHPGRPESMVGAHCYGYNKHSIGVCYVGGTEKNNIKVGKDTRTPEQKEALAKLLAELHQRYPHATLHGHREFECSRLKSKKCSSCTNCQYNKAVCTLAGKPCPCFDVSEYQYIFNDNKTSQK